MVRSSTASTPRLGSPLSMAAWVSTGLAFGDVTAGAAGAAKNEEIYGIYNVGFLHRMHVHYKFLPFFRR